jgi:hypothetical protein
LNFVSSAIISLRRAATNLDEPHPRASQDGYGKETKSAGG